MKKIGRAIVIGALAVCMSAGSLGLMTTEAAVNNDAVYEVTTDNIENWPQGPEVAADVAVLMDADTGIVLYSKGIYESKYPASITKLMTVLVALENSSLEDSVTFGDESVSIISEGSNINAKTGETLTMEQCLYAIILGSANEAALQVALAIDGTEDAFVDRMNQRAQEIGCTGTSFHNVTGLPDPENVTTAYDMSLIMQTALQNDDFCALIGATGYTIAPTNMTSEERMLDDPHPMLVPDSEDYYEGCLGGKMGKTDAAKTTLATAASRDGMNLIAIVMRGEDSSVCSDTKELFDYGFSCFSHLSGEDCTLTVPVGTQLLDLEKSEVFTEIGNMTTYLFGDYSVGGISQSAADIQEEKEKALEEAENKIKEEKEAKEYEKAQAEAEVRMEEQRIVRMYKRIIRILVLAIAVLVVLVILKAMSNQIRRFIKRKKR